MDFVLYALNLYFVPDVYSLYTQESSDTFLLFITYFYYLLKKSIENIGAHVSEIFLVR